jgi:deoxycytidylate deaminase
MCGECAIAAVQAGIDQVYLNGTNDLSDKWDDEMSLVEQIFSEAGVELEVV